MNFIPVSAYAVKHNISVQAVYNRIHRKTIEFKKYGSTYLVRD